MGEMRKRIIAVFSVVVLAVGLLPLPAFAAAGDYVAAGADGLEAQVVKGYVAAHVYALIGNKYAVVVNQKAGEEADSTIRSVEVIDHSYNKVFEMSSMAKTGSQAVISSTYGYQSMTANGFIVKERDTNLLGAVDFEGHEVIPCKYEAMTYDENYYYAARVDVDDNAILDLYSSKSGSLVATKNAGKADYRNAGGTIPVSVYRANTGYMGNPTMAMLMEGEVFEPAVYLSRMNKGGHTAVTSYDKITFDGKELKLETSTKSPNYADKQV